MTNNCMKNVFKIGILVISTSILAMNSWALETHAQCTEKAEAKRADCEKRCKEGEGTKYSPEAAQNCITECNKTKEEYVNALDKPGYQQGCNPNCENCPDLKHFDEIKPKQ